MPSKLKPPYRQVLVLAGPWRGKSHHPDCNWVRGVALDYIAVDAKKVPATIGLCSYCGGGPRGLGIGASA